MERREPYVPVPYITMIVYQNEIKCLHKILYNTAPLIDKEIQLS